MTLSSYIIKGHLSEEERIKSSIFNAIKSGSISTLITINSTIGFTFIGVSALMYASKIVAENEILTKKVTFSFNPIEQLSLMQVYEESRGYLKISDDFINEIEDEILKNNLSKTELKCKFLT